LQWLPVPPSHWKALKWPLTAAQHLPPFIIIKHTHTHNILRPSLILSGTTRVSWHQKGKTNLDLLQQETVSGSGISSAICKSAPSPRYITSPASHHSVFTGRMSFLPPNQQRKSTEGIIIKPKQHINEHVNKVDKNSKQHTVTRSTEDLKCCTNSTQI